MKIRTAVITFGSLVGLALTSCSEVSVADQARLNSTAMSFNQKGADLNECGLSSQFEKGRSTSSQSAGGG